MAQQRVGRAATVGGLLLENGASSVASFLAAERIVSLSTGRAIQEDVRRDDVELQKGGVAELYGVVQSLVEELKEWLDGWVGEGRDL